MINFINKLEPAKANYIFAICTCGAIPMGTLLQVRKQLGTRGLILAAGFSIQMPGNYLVKYGAFTVEMQKKLFNKEKAKVETIVKMIKNQQANKIERNNSLINGIGNLIYQLMLPKFPKLDQNFRRPIWQGNCEHCLACIQWCPTEAIQYGAGTINRKRYRHPEVLVGEIYRG